MENTLHYKSDNWFVSPWNGRKEIVSQYRFPNDIIIHDTTLRDGEQQTGVVFTYDDKIRITEMLAEAGVQRIEVGMPAVSPQDEKAITDLAKRNLGKSQIFAFSRCMLDDIKRAVNCGVKGIVVEIPSSEHIIEHGYGWSMQKAIDLSVQATNYAHKAGLYTVFFTIDASRASMPWLLEIMEEVARNGHMDALTLVDTMGVCTPDAAGYFTDTVRDRFDVPLEAHFHNDFGLANINTIMALAHGAQVAHTTVCGIGERCGGAALEELVMALKLLYGVDCGVDTTKLTKLARTVAELAGHRMPVNKAIVGEKVFKMESGIPSAWLRRCRGSKENIVLPILPELVGQDKIEIVLGKKSGDDSILEHLEKHGIALPSEKVSEVVGKVKQFSIAHKSLVRDEDFLKIVAEVQAGDA